MKQVSKNENLELIYEITIKEVKETVFFMHPDKSSGPDDFNPAFFQSF